MPVELKCMLIYIRFHTGCLCPPTSWGRYGKTACELKLSKSTRHVSGMYSNVSSNSKPDMVDNGRICSARDAHIYDCSNKLVFLTNGALHARTMRINLLVSAGNKRCSLLSLLLTLLWQPDLEANVAALPECC